jgi:hypothetical protein
MLKITTIVATAVLAGISAQAGEARQTTGTKIIVCTGRGIDFDFDSVKERAQLLATRMFAHAGVVIDWRWSGFCPINANIKISFPGSTPRNRLPGALAYAWPFEGVHIEVYYDRVQKQSINPDRLLAHVLVHEITHILQRSDHHAHSGIMKARWTPEDFLTMRWNTLPFTPADLELIRDGFAVREARLGPPAGTALLAVTKKAR